MEQTGHYGLKLPGENDYADVGILNENAQAVDAALHGLEERKADLDPGTGKVVAEQMPPMDYAPSEHIHTWDEVQGKPEVFTPSGHRASHAAGGSDAVTPADIGAAAKSTLVNAVIGTAWTGSAAPYAQVLNITGVKPDSIVEVFLPATATVEQMKQYQALSLQDGGQTAGNITLRAFGAKNTVNIPITVIIRGDV